jgi:hypothetical protein
MAFSTGGGSGPMADQRHAAIDVMLVLLIIFMTGAMLSHKIKIDLPRPTLNPPPESAEPITLGVRTGQLYWNDGPITERALGAAARDGTEEPAAGIADPGRQVGQVSAGRDCHGRCQECRHDQDRISARARIAVTARERCTKNAAKSRRFFGKIPGRFARTAVPA